jgi:hypothetical protein
MNCKTIGLVVAILSWLVVLFPIGRLLPGSAKPRFGGSVAKSTTRQRGTKTSPIPAKVLGCWRSFRRRIFKRAMRLGGIIKIMSGASRITPREDPDTNPKNSGIADALKPTIR